MNAFLPPSLMWQPFPFKGMYFFFLSESGLSRVQRLQTPTPPVFFLLFLLLFSFSSFFPSTRSPAAAQWFHSSLFDKYQNFLQAKSWGISHPVDRKKKNNFFTLWREVWGHLKMFDDDWGCFLGICGRLRTMFEGRSRTSEGRSRMFEGRLKAVKGCLKDVSGFRFSLYCQYFHVYWLGYFIGFVFIFRLYLLLKTL